MKTDLHVHTSHSPDALHDLATMIRRAKTAGLQAIAITDHNKLLSIEKAKELSRQHGILVIPGIEIGKRKFLRHILALNIAHTPSQEKAADILDFIRDEGGVSIAPHPFSRIGFRNYASLPFQAVEARNGINRLCNLQFRRQRRIAEVAGSDAHAAYMLGYTWTETPPAESVDDLLEHIRHGRCKPAGSTVPWYRLLEVSTTLSLRFTVRKLGITQPRFSIEDMFYLPYLGAWARS